MGLMADFLAIAQNTAKLTNSVKRLNKENTRLQDKIADIHERVVRLEARLDTYVEVARHDRLEKQSSV